MASTYTITAKPPLRHIPTGCVGILILLDHIFAGYKGESRIFIVLNQRTSTSTRSPATVAAADGTREASTVEGMLYGLAETTASECSWSVG